MKKLLSFFSVLSLVMISTTNIVACSSSENSSVTQNKQEITPENLDKFFLSHMTWDFKDQFFFKDINEQTKDESIKFYGSIESMLVYLLSNMIEQEFNIMFNYKKSDFFFLVNFDNSGFFDSYGISIDELYKLSFSVIVSSKNNQNEWIYKKK
ncbi:lipoprotein [Spiroplasma eriocheiris]|uniref:Lipoprotein n=1 Tax=Spiroplasma eriocheiris TaxID=315358 RepID=A0A0H3XHX0_9MOLU|nr:lipoprotein [Spiroplasma eriocheiris]AHF57961.1 hypothetical protein SPE_0841 [Spiroplasma eriocheiris CCTCC M 207170]AKM54403.1 hypothetical protein SERIO_v1c08430 [Spiroplasma eriocheiris]